MVLADDGHYRENLKHITAEIGPALRWGWHWRVNYEGEWRTFRGREYVYGRWHWTLTRKAAERRARRHLARLERLTNIEELS